MQLACTPPAPPEIALPNSSDSAPSVLRTQRADSGGAASGGGSGEAVSGGGIGASAGGVYDAASVQAFAFEPRRAVEVRRIELREGVEGA